MLLPREVFGSLVFKEAVVWLILALCGLSKCNQQIDDTPSTMLTLPSTVLTSPSTMLTSPSTMLASPSTLLASPSTMDVQVQDEIRGYLRVAFLISVVPLRSFLSRVVNQTTPTFVCLRSRNINNKIDQSCLETTVLAQRVSFLCKWTIRHKP